MANSPIVSSPIIIHFFVLRSTSFLSFYSAPSLVTTEHCSLFFIFNQIAFNIKKRQLKHWQHRSAVALQTFLPCSISNCVAIQHSPITRLCTGQCCADWVPYLFHGSCIEPTLPVSNVPGWYGLKTRTALTVGAAGRAPVVPAKTPDGSPPSLSHPQHPP